MKSLAIIIGLILCWMPSALLAQSEGPCDAYGRLMQEAESAVSAQNFSLAIRKYNAAKVCNPAESTTIDNKVLAVFELIEQQRDEAIRNEERARTAQRKASKAEALAKSEAERAEQAKNEAERIAVASQNAAKAMQLFQVNPLMALRVAEFNLESYPESSTAATIFHEIVSSPAYLPTKTGKIDGSEHILNVSENGDTILTVQYDLNKEFVRDDSIYRANQIPPAFNNKYGLFNRATISLKHFSDSMQVIMEFPNTSAATISKDRKWLLLGKLDGSLTLKHLENGDTILLQNKHDGPIDMVGFSPDNNGFASAGFDGRVLLWDMQGKLLNEIKPAFLERPFEIIRDTIITVDVELYEERWQIFNYTCDICLNSKFSRLTFPRNSNQLLIAGLKKIYLLDRESWRIDSIQLELGLIENVEYSENEKSIVIGRYDGILKAYSLEVGKEKIEILPGQKNIISFALGKGEKGSQLMIFENRKNRATLFSWDGEEIGQIPAWKPLNRISALSPQEAFFLENGKEILIKYRDGELVKWHLSHLLYQSHEIPVNGAILDLELSPNGNTFATWSTEKKINLWEIDSTIHKRFERTVDSLCNMALSDDGHLLAAGGYNKVLIWDTEGEGQLLLEKWAGEKEQTVIGLDPVTYEDILSDPVWKPAQAYVAFNPDFEHLTYAMPEVGVMEFSITGDSSFITNFSSEVLDLFVSPDNQMIVWLNGTKHIPFNKRTAYKILNNYFDGHTDVVNSIAFSADSKQMISASADNTAIIWDVETKKIVRVLKGHLDDVMAVSFSPDGKYVLTGSADRTVKLWDLFGNQLVTYKGFNRAVSDVTFSADQKLVIAASRSERRVIQWYTKEILLDEKVLKVDLFSLLNEGLLLRKEELAGVLEKMDNDSRIQLLDYYYNLKDWPNAKLCFEHIESNYNAKKSYYIPTHYPKGIEVYFEGGYMEDLERLLTEIRAYHTKKSAEDFAKEEKWPIAYFLAEKAYQSANHRHKLGYLTSAHNIAKNANVPFDESRFKAYETKWENLKILGDYYLDNGNHEFAKSYYEKALKRPDLTSFYYRMDVITQLYKTRVNGGLLFDESYLLGALRKEKNVKRISSSFLKLYKAKEWYLARKTAEYLCSVSDDPTYRYYQYMALEAIGQEDFNLLLSVNDAHHLSRYATFLTSSLGSTNYAKRIERYAQATQLIEKALTSASADSLQQQGARYYNSLGWYQLLNQQFDAAEQSIRRGLELKSDYPYFYTNLPPILLFQGKVEEAKALFLKYKDKPFEPDEKYPTYREVFLDDFNLFTWKNNAKHKAAVEEIMALLNQ